MIGEAKKYFRIKAGSRLRHLHMKYGKLDLDRLPLEVAEKLIQDKWPHIELTEEGEKKYHPSPDAEPEKTEYLVKDVVELIKTAKNEIQVNEYLALKPESTTVQKEASHRIDMFHN